MVADLVREACHEVPEGALPTGRVKCLTHRGACGGLTFALHPASREDRAAVLVLDFLSTVLLQTFWVLYDGGIFVLVGFAIAGLLHVLIDPGRIVRHLGSRSLRSAALAALLGAPLPLCSCGVLPMALAIRKQGASREATISFLITTPETGVDSLAVTYAYFGPLLAIVRPIVAVLTGLIAAAFSLRLPDLREPGLLTEQPAHAHVHDTEGMGVAPGLLPRLRLAARYAFVDLFDDLGFWLAFAFLLTGILSAVLPSDFFARLAPGTIVPMLLMVLLGAPLYVCASASTPLAALFVAKGASAGAALVFLLVGPATNAATVGAVARILGRPLLRIYLGTIVGVAIAAGLLLDLVFPELARNVQIGTGGEGTSLNLVKTFGAFLLLSLLFWSLWRTGLRPGLRELRENGRAAWGWLLDLRPGRVLASRWTQALLALWLVSLLVSGFVWVPAGAVALQQRFGRLVGEPHPPGAVLALPGIDRVEIVRVDEVREQPIGYRTMGRSLGRTPMMDESMFVTGDENVIDLHAEAQYRVSNPVAFQLGVEKPDALLAGVMRARLVEAMAGVSIDRVYTDARAEIEGRLLSAVREDVLKLGLGIDVIGVRLLDVHAPATVHDAFRDVASAHEDRLTTIHRANEYAVGEVALARGNAERTVAGAQAQAVERVASAKGAASAFAALAAEHRRAARPLEDRLYLETAERALAGARKIVRPSAGASGTELWLRTSDAPISFPPQPSAAAPAAPSARTP